MTLNERSISPEIHCDPNNPPEPSQYRCYDFWFSAAKNWLAHTIRHTERECKAIVSEVKYKVNINTLHKIEDDLVFSLNDIGRISLRTSAPLIADSYKRNRISGSFVLIDEQTNETVAAGMIV